MGQLNPAPTIRKANELSVVVAYKYAANPQDAEVSSDGTVDWSRAKASVSEYDAVAIALGRRVADGIGEELIGVSIGSAAIGTSMAKKSAMAKGLDRGIIVADDAVATWNATDTASALAQITANIDSATLFITGDASIDSGARMTSALVAGFLGWPCFQEVSHIEKAGNGWTLTQGIAGGTRQVSVSGPVVIAATSDAAPPIIASMKEILAAGKKPVDVVPVTDLSPVAPSFAVESIAKPETAARKNIMLRGETAAEELVAELRSAGIL